MLIVHNSSYSVNTAWSDSSMMTLFGTNSIAGGNWITLFHSLESALKKMRKILTIQGQLSSLGLFIFSKYFKWICIFLNILIKILIEIDSHKAVRNNTKRSYVYFTLFPPLKSAILLYNTPTNVLTFIHFANLTQVSPLSLVMTWVNVWVQHLAKTLHNSAALASIRVAKLTAKDLKWSQPSHNCMS